MNLCNPKMKAVGNLSAVTSTDVARNSLESTARATITAMSVQFMERKRFHVRTLCASWLTSAKTLVRSTTAISILICLHNTSVQARLFLLRSFWGSTYRNVWSSWNKLCTKVDYPAKSSAKKYLNNSHSFESSLCPWPSLFWYARLLCSRCCLFFQITFGTQHDWTTATTTRSVHISFFCSCPHQNFWNPLKKLFNVRAYVQIIWSTFHSMTLVIIQPCGILYCRRFILQNSCA